MKGFVQSNDLDLFLQNNSLPPALPLPSCLTDTSFLLVLLLTCSTVSCLYELFPLINTAPGVRSNHLIGAPPYLAVNTQIYQHTPSGIRQTPITVPFPSFPLHCTTPGAHHLPTPPLPLHAALHPRATCLSDVCIDTSTEALVLERLLRDLGITGPLRGAFTLLGPDSIYQISL